ncbi:MAG TPA: site-2 protease family protein [Pyrinomonadaceae bacterium]|nr:site-2 protease family protein [Pyrinomonadaceae bacterium]
MGNLDSSVIGQFILYIVALIFSLSVHESAHAWTSNYFGDDLARLQGRISLNPVVHVDPIGTLLFPALSFFTGAPLIGWAKPTPVNPLRWRNKRVANFWVSIAGVICNFIIAIVAGIIIRVLFSANLIDLGLSGYRLVAIPHTDSLIAEGGAQLLTTFFTLNVALGVFNLIPIPPLDGSKVLQSILPPSFESGFEALERFGFILLILAMFTGVFRVIFSVIMPIAIKLLLIGALK